MFAERICLLRSSYQACYSIVRPPRLMWSAATCRSFGVVKTACGASRYGWRGERICGPNRFIGLADSSPPRSDWYLEVNRDVSNTAKLRELAALQKIGSADFERRSCPIYRGRLATSCLTWSRIVRAPITYTATIDRSSNSNAGRSVQWPRENGVRPPDSQPSV